MLDKTINLFEELENISKVHWLDRADIDHIMIDLAKRIVLSLRIERVSIWLLNPDKSAIISIGDYDSRTKEFRKNTVLLKENYPGYFKALVQNRVILAENIHTHEATAELDSDYSRPLGVESLMDIPIRIAGELVGVMCFEKTGTTKVFTQDEQSFAFSLALVLASNLEARHRRAAQHKLEHALIEKDLLIKEINHRVKNNFAILVSMMRISKAQNKNSGSKEIFEEYEQRIMSMLKIHDLLCHSHNYTSIKLSDYIKELIIELQNSHSDLKNSVFSSIEDISFMLPIKNAIHMGLILSEIFLNSIKYASKGNQKFQLYVELSQNRDKSILIKIGDNGPGFNFKEQIKKNSLGLPIIKDLAEGMDLAVKYPSKKGDMYEFLLMP